tara:strand:+ start:7216 stop:7389 length:174 start_codon:yes stop_codon:yes gene_type:complete
MLRKGDLVRYPLGSEFQVGKVVSIGDTTAVVTYIRSITKPDKHLTIELDKIKPLKEK